MTCKERKTCVINDPLGQTHSPAGSFQATFILRYFKKWGTGVLTEICVKIMITTGWVCGSAEWIKTLAEKKLGKLRINEDCNDMAGNINICSSDFVCTYFVCQYLNIAFLLGNFLLYNPDYFLQNIFFAKKYKRGSQAKLSNFLWSRLYERDYERPKFY